MIGLAGEMGSGKGTIVAYLVERYGAVSFRFSDPIRAVLSRLHIDQTRENISTASGMLRSTFGQDIFSRVLRVDVDAASNALILVDGMRRQSEIDLFRSLPKFRLVYVEVAVEERYRRVVSRSENTGDATKTFEEFCREQQLETEQSILSLRKFSDFTLQNDGTLEELYAKTDAMIHNFQS